MFLNTATFTVPSPTLPQIAELLLLYGADANAGDINGRTPLHACASNGHVSCVELLLKHNVNVNAQDLRGNSPLHMAAKWADADVVKALLRSGADTRLKNASGNRPAQVIWGVFERRGSRGEGKDLPKKPGLSQSTAGD